ncbi:MAG TPA: hypothetical protein VG713_16960, partial [Pirellulales bacterium]|nr:hypothetical protein [Pirellulales bacterium]
AGELRSLMLRYNAWLGQLQPVQRAELLAMDNDRRLGRIHQLIADQKRRLASELAPADVKVLADAIEQMMRKQPPADRQRMMMRLIALRWQPIEVLRGTNLPDLAPVRDRLSPEAQKRFAEAVTPQQKQDLMIAWLRQAVGLLMSRNPRGGAPEVTEERLRQFFETQISEAERERLLMLPADEMRMQLRRMYQFGTLGNPWRRDARETQNTERKTQN